MAKRGSGVITVLIPLPVLYNPDERGRQKPVEDEKFEQTAEEIARMFGGGTLFRFRRDEPRGFWWDRELVHRDTLALLEVDVPDTLEARTWLRRYARDVLLDRFRQKAIYLKFVGPVETLIVTDEQVTRD